MLYIPKDLCIWPVKSVKTRYFSNNVKSEWQGIDILVQGEKPNKKD